MSTDSSDIPRYRLRISGLPFEDTLASLIMTVQVVSGFLAGISLVAWLYLVVSSTYHPWMFQPHGGFWEYLTVDWYPGFFLIIVGMAVLAWGLNYLYTEDAS